MASVAYEQVLRVAEALPRNEQLRLIQELVEHTGRADESVSVMELCGLGQEIWQQIDAQEYIKSERNSWSG